jgi:TolB-like protein
MKRRGGGTRLGTRIAGWASIVVLASGAAGCGYRLSGYNPALKHIEVIAVLPFENRTTRPEIEQRITEEVASQLARRSRYRVVTESTKADAVLEGAVTQYRTRPVLFTAEGRAERVEAFVTIQALLRQVSDDTVLWSQSGLIFKEQFNVPPEETAEFFDQESIALDDIAQGAAGVLVTSIFEGF